MVCDYKEMKYIPPDPPIAGQCGNKHHVQELHVWTTSREPLNPFLYIILDKNFPN